MTRVFEESVAVFHTGASKRSRLSDLHYLHSAKIDAWTRVAPSILVFQLYERPKTVRSLPLFLTAFATTTALIAGAAFAQDNPAPDFSADERIDGLPSGMLPWRRDAWLNG